MFSKILVANRGEIACRIIRTARRMGIATVAVYSEADRRALHVQMADEALCIGPPPSQASYLLIDRIVEAARETGAQAVHPGYGFLSENPHFCKRLEREGIAFIGPRAASIAQLGDKIVSKQLAKKAGVPTIPGTAEPVEDSTTAVAAANAIGYPVMIKATAGGGGRGLRVARDDAECREAFASCRSEAMGAFGDDRVFVERYICAPRHIEIQILGDSYGNVVHLWERECSIQRRHQKVFEEAPSPFLDEVTRQAMAEQAAELARYVHYQSAGTVEFVVGSDKTFYFLEMNTRLQVEHPVTEMITGLDIVEQMIRVAAGEPLALRQDDIPRRGWAIEARVCAEDPFRNFLPSAGRLVRYQPPVEEPGAVRVDTGVFEGGEMPTHYDSLVAKVICHGTDRGQALGRLRDALDEFVIRGISENIAFLAAVAQHPRFVAGQFHTGFVAEEYPHGFDPAEVLHDNPLIFAAVAAYARRRYIDRATRTTGQLAGHARKVGTEWEVIIGGEKYPLSVWTTAGGAVITYRGESHELRSDWRLGELLFRGTLGGQRICLQVERLGITYRLSHRGSKVDAFVMTGRAAQLLALMPEKRAADLSKYLLAAMPGLLMEVAVTEGQEVKAGEKLAVIEAMKMQNIIRAEADRVVAKILAQPGESVAVDQPIFEFD